jgi:hypothetical protein
MRAIAAFLPFLVFAASAAAQVDQKRIDRAIKRGTDWLKTAPSPGHEHSKAEHSDELILLTMIHANVPETDARFKALLDRVLADPPHQTYKVALQAMSLEELNRVKYQNRIAQCAQHLVDNQCTNGQWTYGDPTTYPTLPPLPPDVASGGGTPARSGGVLDFGKVGERVKPKVVRKIAVKKQKDGPGGGDNSNTQYAALGLRACFDAGITFEESVIHLATKWLLECQFPPSDGAAANAVVSGNGARPRGWNYRMPGSGEGLEGDAYGSMTVGATGGLTIYDYMMKKDWKKNPAVNSGLAWIASNYSVTANPKHGGSWYYYYLYGLERVGMLYDTTLIGNHDWYVEGAKVLLDKQEADGSWKGSSQATWDTCFAILFLKKATRPLVATESKR